MLIIHRKLIDTIVCRAYADYPAETCGVVAGPAGSGVPTRLVVMDNVARSEVCFRFDPQQQLKCWREMERNGEEPLVIYHSHTNSIAYPSRADIEQASEPGVHHLVFATGCRYEPGPRSFRIGNGRCVEERVKVVGAYRDPSFNELIDTGGPASRAPV